MRCCLLYLLLLHYSVVVAAAPVKIFILIGQSNMEGHGDVAHLLDLANNTHVPEYGYLVNETGDFRTRSDVRIMFNKGHNKVGDLSVGYGFHDTRLFGPEIGFGWTVGEEYNEPILLIKCAVGGTYLGLEWRSPSSILYGRNYSVLEPEKNFLPEQTGELWRLMMDMVSDRLRI